MEKAPEPNLVLSSMDSVHGTGKLGTQGLFAVTAFQTLLEEQDYDVNKSGVQTPHTHLGKSLLPVPQPGEIPHTAQPIQVPQ